MGNTYGTIDRKIAFSKKLKSTALEAYKEKS